MTDNDNFDVFELAKNPDGYTLFKMVLDNFEIYNLHIDSEDEHGNTLLHLIVNHYGNNSPPICLQINPLLYNNRS